MRYVVLIDGKAGAYGVVFPDLPGCTAMGKSVEKALANALDALRDWRDLSRAHGDPIPRPRSIGKLRGDPEVAAALVDGAVLAFLAPPSN